MGTDRYRIARPLALATLAVALATGTVATSCAEDDREASAEEREAVAAARSLQRAFASRDLEALCANMTATAKQQAGRLAHGIPSHCERDLRRAFGIVRPKGGWASTQGGDATATVEGKRATVTFAGADRPALDVGLAREGGRWRLDSFFGTPPQVAQAYSAATRGASVPTEGAAVTAGDGSGTPCSDFAEDDFPAITGTCSFVATTKRMTVDISTVLGDFEFGDCTVTYRVHLAADGTTWTEGTLFESPTSKNNGCTDIRPCMNDANEPMPWKGSIRSEGNGAFVHHMNACLDTCVGSYTGALALKMRRVDGRWRTDAVGAGVGTSGLLLDGRLQMEPPDIELRES
jgi:hypothetical protein